MEKFMQHGLVESLPDAVDQRMTFPCSCMIIVQYIVKNNAPAAITDHRSIVLFLQL